MAGAIVTLFRHHLWANLALLDACAALDDSHLDATAPGTYGSVSDTLLHLFAAEGRYVGMMREDASFAQLNERQEFPGVAELRPHGQRTGDALIAIASSAADDARIRGEYRGEKYDMPVARVVAQAINHGTEHRAHVCTVLTARGVEMPVLDVWTFSGRK